ncbi:MAG: GNAT family N-acetyltransferase [Hyphomicrobiales bacterium]
MKAKEAGIPPLRRAGPDDVPAIRDLSRLAYAKWVPLIGREPLPMTADYERAVAAHMIDLYEVDGALRALIETVDEEGHLLIENLAVHPDLQGNGLGELLLAHARGLARDLGHREIRLYTNAAFASNIAFYAKRGFAEYAREAFPKGGFLVRMRQFQ